MRVHKLLLFLILIFVLVGCHKTSTETTTKSKTFADYASIDTELATTFNVGDKIPNFEDYLIINNLNSVTKHVVESNITDRQNFETAGKFKVTFTIYLLDDDPVSEILYINVNENPPAPINYRPKLNYLLQSIFNSNYLKYTATNDVLNQDKYLVVTTNSAFYINQYTNDNLFHISQIYNVNGETSTNETYFYLDTTQINFYTKSQETNYEWQNTVMTQEEYTAAYSQLGDKSMADILTGISTIEPISEDTNSKTFQIPLSSANFSISIAADILDAIGYYNLYDTTQEDLFTYLANHYDLITLKIKTNSNLSTIIELNFDYTQLLNQLAIDGNSGLTQLSTTTTSDTFVRAIYKESNFNINPFQLTIPPEVIYKDVRQTPTTIVDANGVILDHVVDENSHQVFYTINNSKYLYSYNYETNETNFVNFDLFPEHLYLRNGKVYVSLFGGEHEYYWPKEDQYGAFAIIDASTFNIDHLFNLNFDPGDLVVDQDQVVYIIEGSNQHCQIKSFNSTTGMQLGSIDGLYYDGTLLYSEYTNRIYEIENHSSDRAIHIISIDKGNLLSITENTQIYNKDNLTMSSDGKAIYSGTGMVYNLDLLLNQDTKSNQDLGFTYYQVAFDESNGLRFFSINQLILTMNQNDEITYVTLYSGLSDQMDYHDGKLFNVFNHYFEIIDVEKTYETDVDKVITTISKDEVFNPTSYINNVTNNAYELSLISSNLDVSKLGTYEIRYKVTKAFGTDVDTEIKLFVNVVDDIAPVITVNSEPSSIYVGDSYTPSGCSANDNLDGAVACELVKNNVNSNIKGAYDVIYKAVDNHGNISYKTSIINVALKPLNYTQTTTILSADVTDVEFDLANQNIYYTDYKNHTLIKYNIENKSTQEITFELSPEHLLIDGTTLYVTLLTGEHSRYLGEADQTGKIAVIDLDTFTLTNNYDVPIDPYSLVIQNDYLYINSGSGQNGNIQAYDKHTLAFLGNICSSYPLTEIKLDTHSGYLYSRRSGSPSDILIYQINGLEWTATIDSPYHGEYDFGKYIFVSPYEDYYFTSSGTIFTYNELTYVNDLGFDFTDLYFDQSSNTIYYGLSNGYINIATKDNDYNPYGDINTGYPINQLYVENGTIYTFMLDRSNNHLILNVLNNS